jgi:hypothetical protein
MSGKEPPVRRAFVLTLMLALFAEFAPPVGAAAGDEYVALGDSYTAGSNRWCRRTRPRPSTRTRAAWPGWPA